jgi:hypothetical protein
MVRYADERTGKREKKGDFGLSLSPMQNKMPYMRGCAYNSLINCHLHYLLQCSRIHSLSGDNGMNVGDSHCRCGSRPLAFTCAVRSDFIFQSMCVFLEGPSSQSLRLSADICEMMELLLTIPREHIPTYITCLKILNCTPLNNLV